MILCIKKKKKKKQKKKNRAFFVWSCGCGHFSLGKIKNNDGLRKSTSKDPSWCDFIYQFFVETKILKKGFCVNQR